MAKNQILFQNLAFIQLYLFQLQQFRKQPLLALIVIQQLLIKVQVFNKYKKSKPLQQFIQNQLILKFYSLKLYLNNKQTYYKNKFTLLPEIQDYKKQQINFITPIKQIQKLSSKILNNMASQQEKSLPIQPSAKLAKLTSQQSLNDLNNPNNQNIPSFLLKTYQILQNNKYQDIISWTRNGQGFIVKKIKQFSQTVLPIYFRHNNYTSFVRQLNMYDFHKTRQENQENAFKNFLFKKGQKYLLKEIQRKDYKKNKETNKELFSILEKNQQKNSSGGNIASNSSFNDVNQLESQKYCSKVKQDTSVGGNNLSFPQNQCFRSNIMELKKVKNQMQQKSLKLMCLKQGHLSNQMILKAIDILFQCSLMTRKAFNQIQLLKTDYQLQQRKSHFQSYRNFTETPSSHKNIQQQQEQELDQSQQNYNQHITHNKQIFGTSQKIQTKHSLSGFKQPLTDAKTILFPITNSTEQKVTFNVFENYDTIQNKMSLFSTFSAGGETLTNYKE